MRDMSNVHAVRRFSTPGLKAKQTLPYKYTIKDTNDISMRAKSNCEDDIA